MHGSDYLNQSRYQLLYLLIPIAILLLAIERFSAPLTGRIEKRLLIVAVSGAIALQLPLSVATWRNAEYVDHYYQNTANQIFELGRNPDVVPNNCSPMLAVCGWPAHRREQLLWTLQAYRLNLFSREFDDRHGMYENDAK
jgi:hypothetical protein